MRRDYCTLSLLIEGDEPPREFRSFAAGKNSTRKGTVLFDADAAKRVMSAYAQHGVDVMLDLEHLSLDDTHPNYDPDARGWCQLELRNGELWAVNVRWTPDGEERIRAKKQRYISPAFVRDPKTGRALEVINAAICGMPATDNATPLIAANSAGAPRFAEGARVVVSGEPHMKGQSSGTVAIAAITDVYGIEFDGMTGVHKWYVGDELSPLVAAADTGDIIMRDQLIKMLGLPPEATDEQILAACQAMMAKSEEMAKKLSAQSGDAPKDEKVAAALLSRLDAIERKGEVRDLVTANRRKFAGPAQEQWALSLSVEALKAYVASTPDLPEQVRHTEKRREPDNKSEEITLTAEEREICKLTGQKEEDLIAHKRSLKGAA